MGIIYYVDEKDGQIITHKIVGHTYRSFPDWFGANDYSKLVKERIQTDKEMKEQLDSIKKQNSTTGSPDIIGTLFIKFLIFFFLVFGIFLLWEYGISNLIGKTSGYITTKLEILEYDKIVKDPLDNQIGKIPTDTVLKLKRVSKKGTITWIWCYKLQDGIPVETYILLPEEVGRRKIEKENKYVIYNDNSRTWKAYYEKIDAENKDLENYYAKQFKEKTKDIKILSGKDNVLRESIKDSCFIFPKEGYFSLYSTKDETFYYINKNDKENFINIYRELKKEFDTQKKVYFPKS